MFTGIRQVCALPNGAHDGLAQIGRRGAPEAEEGKASTGQEPVLAVLKDAGLLGGISDGRELGEPDPTSGSRHWRDRTEQGAPRASQSAGTPPDWQLRSGEMWKQRSGFQESPARLHHWLVVRL